MNLTKDLGVGVDLSSPTERQKTIKYLNLKFASLGQPCFEADDTADLEMTTILFDAMRAKNGSACVQLSAVDQRIQNFLNTYLGDTGEEVPRLLSTTLLLDCYGLARELSLPVDGDHFESAYVKSYRIKQGVLHNPKSDRRTTKGVFHVADGGLPVPYDKKEVPKIAFQRMLKSALSASDELQEFPITSTQDVKARGYASLLLRPLVVPAVPGVSQEKRMEIRFFAPGNLVSNLDFVESIFSNGGNPFLPENDAALDPDTWTGHTGCVILAPQLSSLTKKELGLPNVKEATPRQIAEGMAWEKEDELYNDGGAFKITCRDDSGVIVTLISDNYFGYSKKEVKTQIGYSANLFGLAEEEHAGGALANPCYNLGPHFIPDTNLNAKSEHSFDNVVKCLGDSIEVKPEGYAVDKKYPNIFYIQPNAEITVDTLLCTWVKDGKTQSLKVLPERVFVHPSGYKVQLEQQSGSNAWRLIGTTAEGTLIHKPCTVSGGGKSEISKSMLDAVIYGPVFVGDFDEDMDFVETIINKDYSQRFNAEHRAKYKLDSKHISRKLLSPERSLGSVIKVLNPSSNCTEEFNSWLETIPSRIKALVFMVKRTYSVEWGDAWRQHFSVDIVNGEPGHELKYNGEKLVGCYLRVGTRKDGSWCTCKLRPDFMPSEKIQWEDDISASIMVPASQLSDLNPEYKHESVKIVENCEYRFFQRPDDAKVRGYDKQAEIDLSSSGMFISNFEPKTRQDAIAFVEDSVNFAKWTTPVKNMIKEVAESGKDQFFITPAHARIVDGSETKNVRYLQTKPAFEDSRPTYLANVGTRLYRSIEAGKPLFNPVNAVLAGRRNNPADHEAGIRPLAVHNPFHYQELPELFMDFTCSLTGKSPSTTGAGTEGALTKGPFNALVTTADLNNALLSFILSGYDGYTTAAGYIGNDHAVEHDISLLVPEIWSRMSEAERDPKHMIEHGYLEKVEDFEYEGKLVKASRIGYRITAEFVNAYLGRIFETPNVVFADTMLKPETQNLADFVDGINNITENHEKVAKAYIADGSDLSAIPPMRAILHVMATGEFEGKTIDSPEVRKLFTRDYVINSDWYKERLTTKQDRDVAAAKSQIEYLNNYIATGGKAVDTLDLNDKLASLTVKLAYLESDQYIQDLVGTLGADPLCR